MDYLGGYHGTRALDSMCYLLRTWGSSCLSEEIGWPLFPPVNCPSYPLSQLLFNLYLGTRPWPHISPSPLPPLLKVKMLVTQSSLTLCYPLDCSPPGSSFHGILPARILEWVAISSSGGSSWPRDRTWVFSTAGRFFTVWATKEVPFNHPL